MHEYEKILAIILGATIGAIARYYCVIGIEATHDTDFPLGILIINWTGSFFIAVVAVIINRNSGLPLYLAPFLTVGILGSFTTFSTFSLDTLKLIQNGNYILALAYALLSVNGGIFFSWLGYISASFKSVAP